MASVVKSAETQQVKQNDNARVGRGIDGDVRAVFSASMLSGAGDGFRGNKPCRSSLAGSSRATLGAVPSQKGPKGQSAPCRQFAQAAEG